jgi:hypothetical protein
VLIIGRTQKSKVKTFPLRKGGLRGIFPLDYDLYKENSLSISPSQKGRGLLNVFA